jgi:hypothetical protein
MELQSYNIESGVEEEFTSGVGDESSLELEDQSETLDELTLPSDHAFSGVSESWDDTENLDARIVRVRGEAVHVEVLVDRANRRFEDRIFNRDLLKGAVSLEAGNYILLRIFRGKGKIKFTFHNGDKLVDKSIFEDLSRYSDLEDFDFDPDS